MGLGLSLGFGGGGSAASWSPISMPNLAAWYRTDVVVGSPVSQWTDQGGGGYHLTGVGATKPTYSASDAALNGLPSITTTGLLWLQNASLALTDPFAVFLVGYASTGAIAAAFDDAAFPGISKQFLFSSGNMRIIEGGSVLGAAYSDNTKTFAGALFNGASSTIWKDAKTGVPANATSSTAATTGITVGNNRNNDSGGVTLAEVVIVTGSPAQPDINSLANYFAARYSMTIGA